MRAVFFAPMDEVDVPREITGSAMSMASFIGYLPDIILPQMNTFLWNTFGDQGGYVSYFIVSAVFGLLGIGIISIYARLNKKEKELKEAA